MRWRESIIATGGPDWKSALIHRASLVLDFPADEIILFPGNVGGQRYARTNLGLVSSLDGVIRTIFEYTGPA